MYVGFIDLEKAYDSVNRKALWQLFRIYDVMGKLLYEIKSIFVYISVWDSFRACL